MRERERYYDRETERQKIEWKKTDIHIRTKTNWKYQIFLKIVKPQLFKISLYDAQKDRPWVLLAWL